MKEKIWLSPPHMGQNEIFYVKEAFEGNWIAPAGPNIKLFEDSISNFSGVKHAVALNSGTSSIHLALVLLGIERGDEVLCSSFTFIATANPITYIGAVPVLIDSEPDSWNMDPNLLEEAIEERIQKGKKPKAILVVHAYGNSAKLDEILSLSLKYEIPVIEDAAEAFGSTFNKRMLGSFGKIGIYSFNGNKIVTTSSGGALVTSEKEIAEKAEHLADQAKDRRSDFSHDGIGYNYKMSNVLAGIGLGQMKIVYERIKQRRQVFEYYYNALSDISSISFSPETYGCFTNRWLTCIAWDLEKINLSPQQLQESLAEQNIESRLLFKPLHLQKPFMDFPKFESGFSEGLHGRGLCLPSGSALKAAEMDRVVEVVREKFKV